MSLRNSAPDARRRRRRTDPATSHAVLAVIVWRRHGNCCERLKASVRRILISLSNWFGELVNLTSQGSKIDVKATAFAAIKGIHPRDTVETMLATHMVGIHNAMTTLARRLAHVDNIPQQDGAVRALNNLARTYAMQMDRLKRYRDGGKQQVTVEHVTVNEGGQAIAGTLRRKRNQVASDHQRNVLPMLSMRAVVPRRDRGNLVPRRQLRGRLGTGCTAVPTVPALPLEVKTH